jgi:hypothetical protein
MEEFINFSNHYDTNMSKKISKFHIIVAIIGCGVFMGMVSWLLIPSLVSTVFAQIAVPIGAPSNNTGTSVGVTSSGSFTNTGSLTGSGNTIDLGTSAGTVSVKNIYNFIINWEDEDIIFQKTGTYELSYDVDDSSFIVSINAGPVSTTRPEAENALANFLGVSTADACKLNVVVGVDPSVDASLANQGFPMDICASSTLGG